MVTKAVSDQFGKGGIADQMIRFNGFPFLDKEDHQFNESVSQVMKTNVLAIPASGLRLDELSTRGKSAACPQAELTRLSGIVADSRFLDTQYRGFPVVQSKKDSTLLGYVRRADLRFALGTPARSLRFLRVSLTGFIANQCRESSAANTAHTLERALCLLEA